MNGLNKLKIEFYGVMVNFKILMLYGKIFDNRLLVLVKDMMCFGVLIKVLFLCFVFR